MKKLILLLVLLTTASYGADYHSPYDPGAARNTLSNVTPATGRDALGLGTMAVATSTDYVATDTFTAHTSATGTAVHGLGTMAVEAATDYVATDTFTGHTGATGSAVHGLGTISTKADTDYVATSALALRLDTVNASFSGDIDVTGDVGATSATISGAFSTRKYLVLASNATGTAYTSVAALASFTETVDTGNCFTDSVFTAPVTGYYSVSAMIYSGEASWVAENSISIRAYVDGSLLKFLAGTTVQASYTKGLCAAGSSVFYLTAGQTLALYVSSSQNQTTLNDATLNHMSIMLIPGSE